MANEQLKQNYYEAIIAKRDAALEKARQDIANDGAVPRFAPTARWTSLYQQALAELGDPLLLTSRSGEARRALDDVYENTVRVCLAAGPWNFAATEYYPTADTGLITPTTVGYNYGYSKPADWVRTIFISDDQYMVFPLTQYLDSQEIWATDTGEIFVRYVSNDTGAGLFITGWPPNFRRFVELALAERVCMRLVQNAELRDKLAIRRDMALQDALKQNKTDLPPVRFAPANSWQSLYQAIGAEIGDPDLLTVRSGELRRAIDDVYTNALHDCLCAGNWNFAIRTRTLTLVTTDTGVRAGTGYTYGVAKPTDWLKTVMVSDDEYAVFPHTQYYEGLNYWSADTGELIVRYVASDTGTSKNINEWPSDFRRYFELEVAARIYPRLCGPAPIQFGTVTEGNANAQQG